MDSIARSHREEGRRRGRRPVVGDRRGVGRRVEGRRRVVDRLGGDRRAVGDLVDPPVDRRVGDRRAAGDPGHHQGDRLLGGLQEDLRVHRRAAGATDLRARHRAAEATDLRARHQAAGATDLRAHRRAAGATDLRAADLRDHLEVGGRRGVLLQVVGDLQGGHLAALLLGVGALLLDMDLRGAHTVAQEAATRLALAAILLAHRGAQVARSRRATR